MSHFVYILQCSDGSFYTGYTIDLKNRVDKHNSGKGAKYTRSRRPVKVVWSHPFETKSQALKTECALKRMTRKQKKSFIELHRVAHSL